MKFPSLPPGGGPDGYWLDPSGIVWQSNQRKLNHIPDYAPVYTSTTTTTLPNEEDSRNRYVLISYIKFMLYAIKHKTHNNELFIIQFMVHDF